MSAKLHYIFVIYIYEKMLIVAYYEMRISGVLIMTRSDWNSFHLNLTGNSFQQDIRNI